MKRRNGYKVPPLILQPLVENAVKHGFQDVRETGIIKIAGEIIEQQLHLSVADNGPGQKDAGDSVSGIGLNNVRERLEKLFPKKNSLEVYTSIGKGFQVDIKLPLIANE